MWFYAEKWYQKLPFRDRPLLKSFSRLDVLLHNIKIQATKLLIHETDILLLNILCMSAMRINEITKLAVSVLAFQ